jgi:hypothetical protein
MSAGKHADLIRKVESLSALTDSNRLLREEKQKIEALVHTATTEAEQARASVASLQVSVRIEGLVHTATTEAEQARASVASLQVSVRIEGLVHTATTEAEQARASGQPPG